MFATPPLGPGIISRLCIVSGFHPLGGVTIGPQQGAILLMKLPPKFLMVLAACFAIHAEPIKYAAYKGKEGYLRSMVEGYNQAILSGNKDPESLKTMLLKYRLTAVGGSGADLTCELSFTLRGVTKSVDAVPCSQWVPVSLVNTEYKNDSQIDFRGATKGIQINLKTDEIKHSVMEGVTGLATEPLFIPVEIINTSKAPVEFDPEQVIVTVLIQNLTNLKEPPSAFAFTCDANSPIKLSPGMSDRFIISNVENGVTVAGALMATKSALNIFHNPKKPQEALGGARKHIRFRIQLGKFGKVDATLNARIETKTIFGLPE